MAVIFMDSFDHYTSTLTKWTTSSTTGFNSTAPAIAAVGRFGTNGLRCTSNFSAPHSPSNITKTLPSVYSTLILGAGFTWVKNNIATNIPDVIFNTLFNGTSQTYLQINESTSQLQVVRPNGTDNLNYFFTQSQPYYIEFKITCHSSAGSYEVRISETVVGSNSGVNTGNSSAINQVTLQASAGHTKDYDDFYVCDTSSLFNNNYLGDVRIEAIRPNGDGAHSEWDGSDGNSVNNYLLVDETAPNSDTDYVSTITPNDRDTYTMQDLVSTTGEIRAVQYILNARKDDAGFRSIRPIVRLGGVEYGGTSVSLGVGYSYFYEIVPINPSTGVTWTLADINDIEYGAELTG